MTERAPIERWLPVAVGLLLIGIGGAIASRAEGTAVSAFGPAICGMGFMLAGSIFLAFPLARVLSNRAGSLFFPDEKLNRAPPLYSRAEALAKMDHFEESMAAYEQIVEDYPDELKPYIDMIEIAIRHYHDPDRANRIYQQGIATLPSADARDTLSRMYRGIRSRIDEKKDWQKTRILHIGDGGPGPA